VEPSRGLRFDDSKFWVTHRRREYGPFDYEWSKDFCGIELTYQGQKFGEYCSSEEIFADLKEFKLPRSVADVASIVIGCIVFSVLNGLQARDRHALVIEHLAARGYESFAEMRFEGRDGG
jgi:hypothetical protein